MIHKLITVRIPVFVGTVFLALALSVLYSAGLILPSFVGATIWMICAIVFFLNLKANNVPVLSLSCLTIVFYIYVAIMFVWPVIYPQVFISTYSKGFQTPDIFAKANHLTAAGMAAFFAGWLVAVPCRPLPRSKVSRVASIPAGAFPFLVLLSVPLILLLFPTDSIFTTAYNGKAGREIVGAAL